VARFYSNENFPIQTVRELGRLGHDVLTSHEAGNANRSVADEEVLQFAASQRRILLTQNRLHFLRLHQRAVSAHAGIVICTYDPDFIRLAARVNEQVAGRDVLDGLLLRVYRPNH
jgi:predicted nuclease of predicted toxin-antitoxin system